VVRVIPGEIVPNWTLQHCLIVSPAWRLSVIDPNSNRQAAALLGRAFRIALSGQAVVKKIPS
jgi:hypothetical protein